MIGMSAQPLSIDNAPASRPALVRPWIWALLAAVLTLATYLPALAGEFVWDDTYLIEQTPELRSDRTILQHFTKPFWEPNSISPQMSLYYRPLVALSYTLDHKLHGLNSAGYRITNYAFHIANVVLIFMLARRFGAGGLTAGLLSATWGVLPRSAECVAWISGRTDVIAGSFMLTALLVWKDRALNRTLAALIMLLALFCKETALAGVIVLAGWELAGGRSRWRALVARLAILLSPAVLWLVIKSQVSGILPSGVQERTLNARILTSLEAVGRYPIMVFDWLRPRAEIGSPARPNTALAVLGAAVLIATITVVVLFGRRLNGLQRALAVGAVAALLPVLHVIPLTIDVNAADRFLYLPLALLVLLLSTSSKLSSSVLFRGAFAIVLLTSVPVTVARAKSWADPVDLWSTEYTKSGGTCETCRIELAKLLAEAGDFVPALRMQNSLARDTAKGGGVPGLVALNASILYLRIGEYQRALRILTRLVTDRPGVPRFWRELATAQAAIGEFAEAERSAKRALDLMPTYENAETALRFIRTLPKRVGALDDPRSSDAQRADTLTATGRTSEAERLWLAVLRNSPSPAELEGALSFTVNLGSSDAVTHVLTSYPHLLRQAPELATRLRLKDELHQRITRRLPIQRSQDKSERGAVRARQDRREDSHGSHQRDAPND